jgi:hypothetical protein
MDLNSLVDSLKTTVNTASDLLKTAGAPNKLTTPVAAAAPAKPMNFTPLLLVVVGLLALVFVLRR